MVNGDQGLNDAVYHQIRYTAFKHSKIFLRHSSYRCVSNNYRTQAKASVANVATEISGNETGYKYTIYKNFTVRILAVHQ